MDRPTARRAASAAGSRARSAERLTTGASQGRAWFACARVRLVAMLAFVGAFRFLLPGRGWWRAALLLLSRGHDTDAHEDDANEYWYAILLSACTRAASAAPVLARC